MELPDLGELDSGTVQLTCVVHDPSTTGTVKVTGGAVTVEVTTLVAGAVAVMVVVAVVIEMQSGWVMVVVVVRRGSTGSGTEATKATAARWEKKNVKRCILTVIQVSH
jgi:hypothetical protein